MWQHEYQVGDKLNWGGNDNGTPALPSVKVYGILENEICAECGYQNKEDYDILIEYDVIKDVRPAEDMERYWDDGFYV